MQRHHFADKGPYSQSYVFPVVMYRCESWTIKKAAGWRIDAFKLWCWRRLLKVPWTARRSTQPILKETNPETHQKDWCGSWSSNISATWCKELTHWERSWCWGRLKAGRQGDDRGWDGGMASPVQWTRILANSRRQWRIEEPGVLRSVASKRVRHDLVTEQQHISTKNSDSM